MSASETRTGPRLTRFIVPALWPLLVGLSPTECLPVEAAYESFLASSFSVERHMRFTVNGKLKKREVARLTYEALALEIEVLEDEVLSRVMVFDGDDDPVLELEFACSRVEALAEDSYSLTSEDGIETVMFAFDREEGTLQPVSWRVEDQARMLFKKFHIEGVAEYRDFTWKAQPEN